MSKATITTAEKRWGERAAGANRARQANETNQETNHSVHTVRGAHGRRRGGKHHTDKATMRHGVIHSIRNSKQSGNNSKQKHSSRQQSKRKG